MTGKNIIMYCPVCKRNKRKNISMTQCVSYKGKTYCLITCPDCNNVIATIPINPSDENKKKAKINELNAKTGKKLATRLTAYLSHKNYDDSAPEEEIEETLFKHAIDIAGKKAISDNEYDVKNFIQWLVANTFNAPNAIKLESYLYSDIRKDATKGCTICY